MRYHVPTVASVLLGSVLVACGGDSPTEPPPPPPPLTVTITGPSELESEFQEESDLWRCDYVITASAEGGNDGDAAVWQGSTAVWQADGETFHTQEESAAQLADFFGSDRLVTGESQTPDGWFVHSDRVPFDFTETFSYEVPSGEVKTVEYSFTCLEP